MKKLLIAVAVATISLGVFAADLKPYVEGSVGYYNLDDVETETWSGSASIGANTITRASAKIDYDKSWGGGVELGLRNVGIENLRLGASYQRLNLDMKKVTGSATVNGTGYTEDITSVIRDTLGIDLNNHVNLYMLNAYYDFKNSSQFTPFVGVGVGMADIQNAKDNELALSASLGGKYHFDKNVYLGAKGVFTRVNGITDGLNIPYKDTDLWSAHALLGYDF